MAIKSFLLVSLLWLSLAVFYASADPPPIGTPNTTMTTLVRRASPSPTAAADIAIESTPSSKPERTCVREALVALANWRQHCDQGGISPPKCWTRAPSIERCCGQWVDVHDRKYKDYPPIRNRKEVKTGESSWEWRWDPKVDKKGHREVILQTLEGYHSSKRECERWRVESEFGFLGFYEHLHEYGICDADKSGRALDSSVERYDPEGKGYYDDGNPSYPSWAPGGW